MLEWLFGRRTRSEEERAGYPSRRVPNPSTIPFPSDLDARPSGGLDEFAPEVVREAMGILKSTQVQQRPNPENMTLTALVAEWERLNVEFINQVQYVHDMHADLQTLQEQIGVRINNRDLEIEAEFERNEKLRNRIGAKNDTPVAQVAKPDPVDSSTNGSNSPAVVPAEPVARGNTNGSGHGGKPLRNPQ